MSTEPSRDVLVGLGVPTGRIELEERSLTTCENATESTAAIRPEPGAIWVLVTSAFHMPRAIACFEAAGFPVLPYPVDYRVRSIGLPQTFADGLALLDRAAHERLGLLTMRP